MITDHDQIVDEIVRMCIQDARGDAIKAREWPTRELKANPGNKALRDVVNRLNHIISQTNPGMPFDQVYYAAPAAAKVQIR